MKLSPFYSSVPNLAVRLERIGADGRVLFNHLYQADIDPDTHGAALTVELSNSSDLLLRLHAVAILADQVQMSLAVSGGVPNRSTSYAPSWPVPMWCRSRQRCSATGRRGSHICGPGSRSGVTVADTAPCRRSKARRASHGILRWRDSAATSTSRCYRRGRPITSR